MHQTAKHYNALQNIHGRKHRNECARHAYCPHNVNLDGRRRAAWNESKRRQKLQHFVRTLLVPCMLLGMY